MASSLHCHSLHSLCMRTWRARMQSLTLPYRPTALILSCLPPLLSIPLLTFTVMCFAWQLHPIACKPDWWQHQGFTLATVCAGSLMAGNTECLLLLIGLDFPCRAQPCGCRHVPGKPCHLILPVDMPSQSAMSAVLLCMSSIRAWFRHTCPATLQLGALFIWVYPHVESKQPKV